MTDLDKLGNNIRCLRIAYGETQEDLGWAIGVEKNTISYYEKGRMTFYGNISDSGQLSVAAESV